MEPHKTRRVTTLTSQRAHNLFATTVSLRLARRGFRGGPVSWERTRPRPTTMLPVLTLILAATPSMHRCLFISDDHGGALREWRAAAEDAGTSKLTVLHVDAHNDLNVPAWTHRAATRSASWPLNRAAAISRTTRSRCATPMIPRTSVSTPSERTPPMVQSPTRFTRCRSTAWAFSSSIRWFVGCCSTPATTSLISTTTFSCTATRGRAARRATRAAPFPCFKRRSKGWRRSWPPSRWSGHLSPSRLLAPPAIMCALAMCPSWRRRCLPCSSAYLARRASRTRRTPRHFVSFMHYGAGLPPHFCTQVTLQRIRYSWHTVGIRILNTLTQLI
jgi:hypothetical protein